MTADPRNTHAWQTLSDSQAVFDETAREYHAAGLTLDLTTAGLGDVTRNHLLQLAEEMDWSRARTDLLSGAHVNTSEKRPALHTALRAMPDKVVPAVREDVKQCHDKINACLGAVQKMGTVNIIHVGIGGSALAPILLRSFFNALAVPQYRLHIVMNADPMTLNKLQQTCDPQNTIVIIASKSFKTEDTMLIAHHLREWLGNPRRLFAVTGQPKLAQDFGVPLDQIVPLQDWLGGRFSLWGGVSLPILLTFGAPLFEELQHGARLMDQHFATAPAEKNLPLLFALAHIWQRNFMGCFARAIVPYADALHHLPTYLQQLEMECNGKPAGVPTAPVVFGGAGTTVQHSFMQWLHQGSDLASTDFILVDRMPGDEALGDFLRRNALAQSAALAHGSAPNFAGGRPSNLIFMPTLSAKLMGALIALYEHKVYLEAHLWGINCFDQPGVELGKKLARQIAAGDFPRSTEARLARYK